MLPANLLAPDMKPTKPAKTVVMDPTAMKPKPKLPPHHAGQPDYGDINLSMTNKFCLEANANACETMTDMCAALNSVNAEMDQSLCQGVQSFCEKQQQMGQHMHMDLSAKVCLNFEASAKACDIVAEVCEPGSKAAGSQFCQQTQAYCATGVNLGHV